MVSSESAYFWNLKILHFPGIKFGIYHFRHNIPYFEPSVEMGNFENGNHAQKYKILSVVDDFKPRLTRTVTARERREVEKLTLENFQEWEYKTHIIDIHWLFIGLSSLFVPTYWSVVCGYIFYLAKVDEKSSH